MGIIHKLIMIFGPLLMLATAATPENSLGTTLASIGFISLLVFTAPFVLSVIALRKAVIYVKNAPHRTFSDVTNEQRPIPEKLHHFLPILDQLGFTRIGEIERRMPSEPDQIWFVFGRTDGLIRAEVIPFPKQSITAFQTMFADQAMLETSFPIGIDLSTPYMRSVAAKADLGLAGAYQAHQRAGMEMMQQHGAPLPVHSLHEHLTWTEYVQQHYTMPSTQLVHRRALWTLAPNVYIGFWIAFLCGLLVGFGGYQAIIGFVMVFLLLPLLILVLTPTRFIH